MNNEQKSKPLFSVKDMCFIAIFCALICILSPIAVPLPGGVPMTLQTLIIPISALVIGTRNGTIATVLYLIIGAVGVPVFSNYNSGIGVILGLTGGFLVSFPLMTFLAGFFETKAYKIAKHRNSVKYYLILLIGLVAGSVANYAVGTIWYAVSSGNTLEAAFVACVLPFIPTAIIKIAIAAVLAPIVKTALVRAGILEPVVSA